jgi:hypothetical protein
VAVTTEITPTQVVRKNDDDIGLRRQTRGAKANVLETNEAAEQSQQSQARLVHDNALPRKEEVGKFKEVLFNVNRPRPSPPGEGILFPATGKRSLNSNESTGEQK